MSLSFFDSNMLSALIRIALTTGTILGVIVYLMVWAERRVSAFIQGRLGPNRVGPLGLLQGLADGVKFIFKEELMPSEANKFLFLLAPFAAVLPAILAFAPVPYGMKIIDGNVVPAAIANLDVGVLFVLSVTSLGVFSIILGGWASNSKYPVLGGLRAAAQVISYEIPMGLAIMAVLLVAGTTNLTEIVQLQSEGAWFVLICPIGFLIFVVSIFAETNRLPFDMPEGETEIIGFHAEYSSMKFAMFFMAEYANMVTASCIAVLLFLGGWEFLPFVSWSKLSAVAGVSIYEQGFWWLLPVAWFMAKVSFVLILFIWVRWTLPRFRYDQLMRLGWKKLIPLSLLNIVITMLIVMWVV
ncbi:MAG: NADH-quinone oxidoreductase subunit NuoH [Bdellovibrionales bacterium]|nr:NADH-quinone oxidoreductase subunit NuoH [Bdellovibrionales bacterium]